MHLGLGLPITRCGVAPAFTPADLSGLVLWLTAGPAYCFQDAGAAVPCGDGDAVYTWLDRSGQGNHLTQPVLAARPILYALGGGLWCVTFDGTDDYLRAAGFDAGSNCSLYFRTAPVDSLPFGLFDSAPSSANTMRQGLNFADFEGTWEWHSQAPKFDLGLTGGAWATLSLLHSLAPARRVVYRRDGSQVSDNADASTTAAAWTTPIVGVVNGGLSGAYAGDAAGVLVYSETHNATQAALVEGYMNGLAQ